MLKKIEHIQDLKLLINRIFICYKNIFYTVMYYGAFENRIIMMSFFFK